MTKRYPLIAPDDPWLTQTDSNPVARYSKLRDALDAAYGGILLPSGDSFLHDDVRDVYVSERTNLLQDVTEDNADSEFLYERYLHNQFWDQATKRRLVCLIGAVGTGKTTLLDYYFRCYCPRHNSQQFREKLYLYVDAKGIQTPQQLDQKINKSLTMSIASKCKARGFDIQSHLNIGNVAPEAGREWEWITAALSCISSLAESDPLYAPFKYIVLTIDNVDQTPLEVQQRALVLCREFLDDRLGIRFWRIYIPMWPQTLDRIENYLGMVSKAEREYIQLGPMSGSKVRMGRQSRAESRIRDSAIISIIDSEDETEDRVDEPAGGKSSVVSNDELRKYVRNVTDWIVKAFEARLDDLFYDDARRQLDVMWNVLRSKAAWRSWRNAEKSGKSLHVSDEIIPYALIDATLTGDHRAFNSADARLPNIYGMSEYSLLPGLHFVCLLDAFQTGGLTRQRTAGVMARLGHKEFEVEEMMFSFLGANLFHERAGDGMGVDHLVEYVVHGKAVSAFLWLTEQPAYVDNSAMLCSLPKHRLERMHRTSSQSRNDFRLRVESTVEFIKQMRSDEVQFLGALSQSQSDDLSKFISGFKERSRLTIPFFWKRIGARYEERLVNVRRNWRSGANLKHIAGVDEEWWSRVIEDPLFRDAKKEPYWLLE